MTSARSGFGAALFCFGAALFCVGAALFCFGAALFCVGDALFLAAVGALAGLVMLKLHRFEWNFLRAPLAGTAAEMAIQMLVALAVPDRRAMEGRRRLAHQTGHRARVAGGPCPDPMTGDLT